MLDQMANEIKLLSGSSHPELSAQVASRYVFFLSVEKEIRRQVRYNWLTLRDRHKLQPGH